MAIEVKSLVRKATNASPIYLYFFYETELSTKNKI